MFWHEIVQEYEYANRVKDRNVTKNKKPSTEKSVEGFCLTHFLLKKLNKKETLSFLSKFLLVTNKTVVKASLSGNDT